MLDRGDMTKMPRNGEAGRGVYAYMPGNVLMRQFCVTDSPERRQTFDLAEDRHLVDLLHPDISDKVLSALRLRLKRKFSNIRFDPLCVRLSNMQRFGAELQIVVVSMFPGAAGFVVGCDTGVVLCRQVVVMDPDCLVDQEREQLV